MHVPSQTLHTLGGIQKFYNFPNGYGAYVIKTKFSYGGEAGKWELAVLRGHGSEAVIAYDTGITDDVIGWLNDEDLEKTLDFIEALPPVKGE